MRRVVITAAGAVGAVAIGALAAACGGPSATGAMSRHSPAGSPAGRTSGTSTVVALHAMPGLGARALVGAGGRALYLFEGDRNGKPRCAGACAVSWPPYLVSAALRSGSGVNPALLGAVARPDGTTQVTYNGHPLYYFTGDRNAGTDHGQGLTAFGADWYLVGATGSKIDTS